MRSFCCKVANTLVEYTNLHLLSNSYLYVFGQKHVPRSHFFAILAKKSRADDVVKKMAPTGLFSCTFSFFSVVAVDLINKTSE